MSILYKPVLIESAEQAEALPKGVVAIRVDGLNEPGYGLARKDHGPGEDEFWYFPDAEDAGWNEDVLGWTALAPIEAEETHSEDYGSYHLMEAVDGPKPFTAYLVDQEEA